MEAKSPDVFGALRTVFERLLALAVEDPGLRAGVRDLGQALSALAKDPPASAVPSAPPAPTAPTIERTEAPSAPAPTPEPAPRAAPVRGPSQYGRLPNEPSAAELAERLFRTPPPMREPEPEYRRPVPVVEADLPLIAERLRLKAEAASWLARRRRSTDGFDLTLELEDELRNLIARAKSMPDCFLWMCHRECPISNNPYVYAELTGCFEAAAAAATLLVDADLSSAPPELASRALFLAAETQSALRVAVATLGGLPDSDQSKFYFWIRDAASDHNIWIDRHMRQDDPADPLPWDERIERARALEESLQQRKGDGKKQKRLFNKIRFVAKQIEDNEVDDLEAAWLGLMQTVEELLQAGVPASNREIRDALLPIVDGAPDSIEWPRNYQLVVREIERYREMAAPIPQATEDDEPPTPEVREVARLLQGKTVVLICGMHRPAAERLLVNAFGLERLVWIEARDQSYLTFEPAIADPKVAAVLLAIRWSRHGFGDVKSLCDAHGKPLVRLPRGYNPNQVAYEILHQVGARLSDRYAGSGRNGA